MIEILQQILLKDTKQAIDILVLLNIIVFPTCFLMYLLLNICKPQLQEDVRLFDVNLLKWKLFDRGSVQLSFSYILDVRGGLSFFIFPICKNKFKL